MHVWKTYSVRTTQVLQFFVFLPFLYISNGEMSYVQIIVIREQAD